MRGVAEKYRKQTGRDLIYSPAQPAGEGQELMSWLSRTGRSKAMFTLSPYAAPVFTDLILSAFEEHGVYDFKSNKHHQINNPSIFFLLKGSEKMRK